MPRSLLGVAGGEGGVSTGDLVSILPEVAFLELAEESWSVGRVVRRRRTMWADHFD